MNILIVGSGKGSFTMRGQQLGAALGARVVGAPSDTDLRWADIVVLIKRAGLAWADLAHRFGKPIVWDALDFWAQPKDNGLDEKAARALLQSHIAKIKPALVIGATEAMAQAAGGVYLPHHSWHGLSPTPAREVVSVVGYEGNALYLGRWRQSIEAECRRRGWSFVINPIDLRACDILVALRDGPWDGWMCREWKSGVKLVNAIAAGRPIVTQLSAAWREIGRGFIVDVQHSDLPGAFDAMTGRIARNICASGCEANSVNYTLETIAARYLSILAEVCAGRSVGAA